MNLVAIDADLDLLQPQVGVPASGLESVANDCLRFTMHFFQLIQQSARHIYHSALPISPESSIFSSMSLPNETRISDFHGRPDRWGSVVRTITSIPGGFTCMTTIGRGSAAKIAGACDDGTVRIYDSVTGVLRLSLKPEFPVLEITGLPDGSLLVCTHSGRPLITLWDIQTGGLVHAFILEREAKHTTVSLNGRYLACEGSKTTVNIWKTASRMQHPNLWERFQGSTPCWLAPEELLMVVNRGLVCIQNIVLKGPPVHKFEMPSSVHSAVYSPVFDRLAIVSLSSRNWTSFTILNVKTSTSSTFHAADKPLSSIAFSQTTNQLVGGGDDPGLEAVDILTGLRTRFDFPVTVTSVSTLLNGTVVANVQGSGIQLLSLDQERASPQQPTPPLLAMFPLDGGRILVIVPATNDDTALLETTTMSQVFSVPIYKAFLAADVRRVVLCASLKNKIALCYYRGHSGGCLEMWEFSHQDPRWTVPTDAPPSVSGTSPACTRLVTFHKNAIRVSDASNGRPMAETIDYSVVLRGPLEVTFDSETRFYIHYGTHRGPYHNYRTYRDPYDIYTTSWVHNPTATHHITRHARQWLEGQVLEKRYRLDDGREWVVCGSQRICWVPPGYIGSAPDSHCWAGSSLVMVGQDGRLRKLSFLGKWFV